MKKEVIRRVQKLKTKRNNRARIREVHQVLFVFVGRAVN